MITIRKIQSVHEPMTRKIMGIQFEIFDYEHYLTPQSAFYCVNQSFWSGVRIGTFPSNYLSDDFVFKPLNYEPMVFHTIVGAINEIKKLLEELTA